MEANSFLKKHFDFSRSMVLAIKFGAAAVLLSIATTERAPPLIP